jgi:hypothetical protein
VVSPPVAAFLATRALLVVFVALCLKLFPTHTILDWQVDAFPGNVWLNGWLRWDAMWYEALVDGAAHALPPQHSSANFFPLYAWTGWVAALPWRLWLPYDRAFFVGALVVSHASFLIGLCLVFEIAADLVDVDVATRAVWLIACFPFSFFFSAAYSDALYLCLAAATFRLCQRHRFRAASASAAGAIFVRIPGVSLAAVVLIAYAESVRWKWRALHRELAAGVILGLAVLGVLSYFWIRYGSPMAFVHARQTGWGRAAGLSAFASDWREFTSGPALACGSLVSCVREWDLTRHLLGYSYAALLPIALALAWAGRRTIGAALSVWVFVSVALAIPNGLDGVGRFTAVLFPVFIVAARALRTRRAVIATAALMLPFLLLFAGQFARWKAVL